MCVYITPAAAYNYKWARQNSAEFMARKGKKGDIKKYPSTSARMKYCSLRHFPVFAHDVKGAALKNNIVKLFGIL